MKPVRAPFPLSVVALLAGIFLTPSVQADTTLVYGELGEKADPETGKTGEGVVSAQRLYIREGMLAMETFGESRVILFNEATGTVRLVDHDNKTYTDLDAVMVAKMAERLTETQQQVLKGLDQRLAEMPKKEREELRLLLDELHEATDLQLSKPPKYRYQDSPAAETIDQFETSVVDAWLNDQLVARYHLVDHKILGMTDGEYRTLVKFQDFVRRLFEQTPGVLRRHFGDFEMLAKSGRVPVQVIRYETGAEAEKQKLLKNFNGEIDPSWFAVPEGFEYDSLLRGLIPPGTGA